MTSTLYLDCKKIIFSLLYCISPLIIYEEKQFFPIVLIVIFSLLFFVEENKINKYLYFYIVAASFFGVSVLGIKLYNWIVIIEFIILLLKKKILSINNNIYIYALFITYVVINTIIRSNELNINASLLSIGRLIFAFLALVVYSQSMFSEVDIKSLVKNIDFFMMLLCIQTMVMKVCYNVLGVLNGFDSIFFKVSVYGDISSLQAMNGLESRGTGFFSDPNKLLCFIILLLCLRCTLSKSIKFDKAYLFYIIGMALTGSRLSYIVIVIFLIFKLLERIFKNTIIAFLNSLLVVVIIGLIVMLFNVPLNDILGQLSNRLLSLIGRSSSVNSSSDITSDNRFYIWNYALPYIKNHWIIGNGLASESTLLPFTTHNTVIYLLLDTGIIGTILYFVFVLNVFYKYIGLINFIIFLLIPFMFLDLVDYNVIFFVMGICMALGEAKKNDYFKYNYSDI